jgi:asparagine synthase (glutamine-hydrolysing)
MCGIAGLFAYRPTVASAEDARNLVGAMSASLVHRGPDDAGIWVDAESRCVLASRRLSVIDVSDAGHQPMSSFDGRWVVAYNGEIYNFAALRPLLEARGIAFRGHADTEVLVNGIATWGTATLGKLDGMFAFAAFDTVSGELLLARDPFGEKPLYYLELPHGGLAFASEVQALERVPGFDGEMSLDAMAELLMFQYIGAPRSIYRSVSKLPPGHWLRAAPGEPLRVERYFEFRPGMGGFDTRPLPALADELEDLLERSVRSRMVADVPLGAFLSGGVDSSTVCALIRRKAGLPLKTFSIGFAGAPESEHAAAREFARHLGTEHTERIVAPVAMEALAGLGALMDEPNADWSCLPVYWLSELAREQVTVAVSGDGGDEMFGGYDRYLEALDSSRKGGTAGSAGATYYNPYLLDAGEKEIAGLFGGMPSGLAEHLRRLREEIDHATTPLLCRLRESDVENYLPGAVLAKVDRMSMRHSLEVRTPYLGVELARFAERLPPEVLCRPGSSKLLLREVAYRHLPRPLIDRPKLGFGLPNVAWASREIHEVSTRLLGTSDSRLRAFFGARAMDALLARPRASFRWCAFAVLESWCRYHPAKLPEIRTTVH